MTFQETLAIANARLAGFIQGIQAKTPNALRDLGQGASRRDQILAACTVPFVIVLLAGFALSIKQVIDGVVPTNGPLSAISFLVGTSLLCVALAGCFAWIKTGGFGIFGH